MLHFGKENISYQYSLTYLHMNFSYFSRELTPSVMNFEIVMWILLLGVLWYGISQYRFFLWRFFALVLWVFCFEWLTWALWNNSHLWVYAYIHNDVSWVLTLTWATFIFIVKFAYDKYTQHKTVMKEFFTVVLGSSALIATVLAILKEIDVFSYSSATLPLIQKSILIFWRPLEAVIYIPVFIFTVYAFYKYWELAMYDKSLFSKYTISPKKDIFISAITILLIWYLMHPLLETSIVSSFLLVFLYIIGLILTSFMVNSIKDAPLFQRYMGGMFIFSVFAMVVMSLMIENSMITLAQSVRDTYTANTISIPWFAFTDVEFVGIVLFSCLMLAMVKYFKVITDNKDIKLDEKKMTFRGWRSLFKN